MKYNKHLLCADSIFNKKVRWLFVLFLLFVFSFFYPQSSLKVQAADGDIAINADNFPDNNFRDYLRSRTYGADGQLTKTEIGNIGRLDVSSKEISSLKGIEYFTELTSLSCSGNKLTNLDISNNTKLTELRCFNNQLTDLDVSNNTNLTSLSCESNQLTDLDVSNNANLISLSCENNQLTDLDVRNNTNLTSLFCQSNQLTDLDVSNNTNLITLFCQSNRLTSLDVSNITNLIDLSCDNNQYVQKTDSANRINIADLPGNFNIGKADEWTGAKADGTNVITATGGIITYRYECGNGRNYKTFTIIPEFQISYQLNGGTNHKDNLVSLKATDNLSLKNPTRTGYTFAGWYSDASFKTKVTSLSGESIVSGTLYAKWTPNQYMVTFDARKGTVSPKTKNVVYDAQYGSLPTPKRTGYWC